MLVKEVGAIRMWYQMNLVACAKMMAVCKDAGQPRLSGTRIDLGVSACRFDDVNLSDKRCMGLGRFGQPHVFWPNAQNDSLARRSRAISWCGQEGAVMKSNPAAIALTF